MRLFIAVNFNYETQSLLLELRDELRSRSADGNFSAPENLHMTLAFLGECSAKQTAAAKACMDALHFQPFTVMIDRVGRFKGGGGGDGALSKATWWAGTDESGQLINLHHDLTGRLIEAGFELDRRKFSPHITLGREVETDTTPWAVDPFGETITSIELMKSERVGGKLTYTAIYAVTGKATR